MRDVQDPYKSALKPSLGRRRVEDFADVPVDLGGLPDQVERRCTDVPCCLIFFLFFAIWSACMARSLQSGDIAKLNAFEDGDGKLCRLGGPTPYLFFCYNRSQADFDLYRPICRASCPTGGNTTATECRGDPDYSSYRVMGMLCMPDHWRTVRSRQQRRALESWSEAASASVLARVVIERWRSLLACAIIAVFGSYIMIYVLENHARCLVRLGLCSLTFGTLLIGLYMLDWLERVGLAPVPSEYNLIWGIGSLIVSMLFGCVLVAMRNSVDTAVDCIELACKCIFETKSLALHPLIMAIVHAHWTAISVFGTMLALSCGSQRLMHDTVIGLQLGFAELWSVVAFVFMWLWVHQAVFAMSEFVIAYASAMWYFQEAAQAVHPLHGRHLWKAYWAAHRYHMGTILLGSFVISYSRIWRMTLGPLVSWSGMNTNPVARFLRCFCCCFLDCYAKLNPLSKNAFIDVAMNSRPFFRAARGAEAIVQRESDTIRILNGATWLFQLAGLSANAGLAACAMAFYSVSVVGDDGVVTVTMCFCGACTAVLTALPFAMIFDTVSDTILYCSAVEELRRSQAEGKPKRKSLVARVCPCVYRPTVVDTAGTFVMQSAVWEALTGGAGGAGEGEEGEEEQPEPGSGQEDTAAAAARARLLLPPEALVDQATWKRPPPPPRLGDSWQWSTGRSWDSPSSVLGWPPTRGGGGDGHC